MNKQGESRRCRALLARSMWNIPLCTIIVTHRNYTSLVGDALLSVLEQTYDNWECIVVDDDSSNEELDRLKQIIERASDNRIRLLHNSKQLGQIETFFCGLEQATGEFRSSTVTGRALL